MLEKIDLELIKKIAIDAGKAVMQIYKSDFEVKYKNDKSPLTEADLKANEIICKNLVKLYPEIPMLSEENKEVGYKVRQNWEYYWCIDPIDGTKEFVKKNGEFTINIALIHKNKPVLGVVYAPVLESVYYAKKGHGAYKNGKKLPFQRDDAKYIIVASKSHMSEETKVFIEKIKTTKNKELISMGSSLKICLVAEGSADIYPRFAPTMEWDTAAAHGIILESGFNIIDATTNESLQYNKEKLLNNSFIVSK